MFSRGYAFWHVRREQSSYMACLFLCVTTKAPCHHGPEEEVRLRCWNECLLHWFCCRETCTRWDCSDGARWFPLAHPCVLLFQTKPTAGYSLFGLVFPEGNCVFPWSSSLFDQCCSMHGVYPTIKHHAQLKNLACAWNEHLAGHDRFHSVESVPVLLIR